MCVYVLHKISINMIIWICTKVKGTVYNEVVALMCITLSTIDFLLSFINFVTETGWPSSVAMQSFTLKRLAAARDKGLR